MGSGHAGDETEPVLLPRYRTALRAESLPRHLPPAAVRLHREVRRRLQELDLAVDHASDPVAGAELQLAAAGLRELLAGHLPLHSTRCPRCRNRWGRSEPWPCHVWRTTYALLVGAARR